MSPKRSGFQADWQIVHPFLWGLYHFLRAYVRLGTFVYFRELYVLGRSHLKKMDGPVIVIVNHPSTLMDVLLPGPFVPRVMFFLANYGLFKHPVSNWLLRRLYCIPVQRKEDVAEGVQRNNDSAFEQSFRHLESGGVLFIAPEGVSWMNRFVRPFKTGTARIALGAEARHEGQLGLRILPIGHTYAHPTQFRSGAIVHVGEPVLVSDWLPAWKTHPEAAVEALTAHLQQTVQGLTIHTVDEGGEQATGSLEILLQNDQPLPFDQAYVRIKEWIPVVLPDHTLRDRIQGWFDRLNTLGVTDQGVKRPIRITDAALLVCGWPIWLAAMFFWFLPAFIPGLLAKRLRLYVGYTSTIHILTGALITFPLAVWAVGAWVGLSLLLPVLAAFLIAGWFAEIYADTFQAVWARRRFERLSVAEREALSDQRAALMQALYRAFAAAGKRDSATPQ